MPHFSALSIPAWHAPRRICNFQLLQPPLVSWGQSWSGTIHLLGCTHQGSLCSPCAQGRSVHAPHEPLLSSLHVPLVLLSSLGNPSRKSSSAHPREPQQENSSAHPREPQQENSSANPNLHIPGSPSRETALHIPLGAAQSTSESVPSELRQVCVASILCFLGVF